MCLLAVAATVTALLPRDTSPLAAPEPGGVSAQWLGDDPVFVVRDDDGAVRVLDAVSPSSPLDFRKVLAWCESSRSFEDLWDGSKFDHTGTYLGGPAPTGMAQFEVTSKADAQVRVGARGPAPKRPAPTDSEESPPRGPACDERTALYLPDHPADPAVLADLVLHRQHDAPADLWIPTSERVLGQIPTHPCWEEVVESWPHVCASAP